MIHYVNSMLIYKKIYIINKPQIDNEKHFYAKITSYNNVIYVTTGCSEQPNQTLLSHDYNSFYARYSSDLFLHAMTSHAVAYPSQYST